MSVKKSFTLTELNDYIRRVFELNFKDPIWIKCEISSFKESRGFVYLDMVDTDEHTGEIKSQNRGIIRYQTYYFIKKKLGDLAPNILTEGAKVLFKLHVSYHVRWGLSLEIIDVDPSFTIGQLEIERQKIIQRLQKEGLIEKNTYTYLPEVIQNIAVISAPNAAGYIDFVNQIKHNDYGYAIRHDLFAAALQGSKTAPEVCHAIDQILSSKNEYDCICILRGGGSKLDLASFDNYSIGAKIAHCPLPVITGIGHEIDNTIADLVSHTSVKTPTAVATFIIERNAQFEYEIIEAGRRVNQLARQIIERHKLSLQHSQHTIENKPAEMLKTAHLMLNQKIETFRHAIVYAHNDFHRRLDHYREIIKISDPKHTVAKGFAIVRDSNGKIITSTKKVSSGQEIHTLLKDGNLISIVK